MARLPSRIMPPVNTLSTVIFEIRFTSTLLGFYSPTLFWNILLILVMPQESRSNCIVCPGNTGWVIVIILYVPWIFYAKKSNNLSRSPPRIPASFSFLCGLPATSSVCTPLTSSRRMYYLHKNPTPVQRYSKSVIPPHSSKHYSWILLSWPHR